MTSSPPRRPGGAQQIPRPAVWEPGGLTAPAAHPLRLRVDDIARALVDSPPGRPLAPAFPGARLSAVLVALADGPSGAEVLLTRRSRHLTNHKGEIIFPGGRLDPGETPEEALVRELREELGIETAASCLAPIAFASHGYETFHLLMPLFACRKWQGTPQPHEGQTLRWVPPIELSRYPMPPADLPLVGLLRDLL